MSDKKILKIFKKMQKKINKKVTDILKFNEIVKICLISKKFFKSEKNVLFLDQNFIIYSYILGNFSKI